MVAQSLGGLKHQLQREKPTAKKGHRAESIFYNQKIGENGPTFQDDSMFQLYSPQKLVIREFGYYHGQSLEHVEK